MVGGFIYLNNVYKTPIVTSTDEDDLLDEFYDEQSNYDYGGS